MKWLFHWFILMLCFIFPEYAFSDVLVSMGGDKLSGTLITFTRTTCTFAPTMSNSHIDVEWTNIKSLQSESNFVVELEGGDRISGTVFFSHKRGLEVSSSRNKANMHLAHLKSVSPIRADMNQDVSNASQKVASGVLAEHSSHNPTERKLNPIGQKGETNFGEEMEEAPLTFLRGSTVQLRPGEIEGRMVLNYQPTHQSSIIGDTQMRLFTVGLSANIGIHERFEGFINVPISYSMARDGNLLESNRDTDFALGDISFGITGLLVPESVSWPEIDINLSVTAPTGSSPYDNHLAYTGNGHWVGDIGLSFVRSVEPAILFGGISAGYIFSTTEHGDKYQYGWKGDYHFGLGFAINDRLSVSSVLQGGYRPPLLSNGISYNAFSQDPLSLSFSMGYRLNSNLVLEPSVSFGLNGDAGSGMFSLGVSRKFN